MIKRDTTVGEKIIVTYICDNCVKEMPGAPIIVYYPYGHINDSLDGPSHFCKDKCVVEFTDKLVKKYGPWKSEAIESKKVRSSETWRKTTGKTPPKARRVVRRRINKRKQKKQ